MTRGVGRMSTEGLQRSAESLCRVTTCGQPDLSVAVVLFVATGLLFLLSGAVLSRLADAREAVEAEHRRTRAERDAFERFRRRVSGLDTSRPAPPDPGGGVAATGGTTGGGLRATRRAYEETVMSTPHFDEEYDESLATSVAAEFNGAVAGAVTSGTALTPELRRTLVRGAASARDRRDRLLSDLETEAEALRDAEETLRPAVETVRPLPREDATVADHVADAERLDWYEDDVRELLADRQRTVRSRATEHDGWYDYLYAELPGPHPVLAAGTATVSLIEGTRDELAAAVADPD